jgi:predicted lipoprotein with Yx(FWY)xxD motif
MGTRFLRRTLPLGLLAAVGASVAVAATMASHGTVNSVTSAKYGALLATANGRTLYHMTSEKRGKIVCTGACTNFWPPLVIKSGAKATAGTGVKQSKLGTVKRPDGSIQVTYNGYALYRFANDKKRGDVKGQGFEHIWFAVTPAGTLAKAGGGGTTTTSSTTTTDDTTTSGYGYGGSYG